MEKEKEMSSPLLDSLSKREKELSDEVFSRLRSSRGSHYQKMDEGLLRKRAENLVDSFLHSVKGKTPVFVDYVGEIAQERIAEGFDLQEIQAALQFLEEKTWQLVEEDIPQADQVSCLGRVTRIIGTAKDQLAQVYLERMENAERRAVHLKKRIDELAKGTDSGPVEEDDLY